MASTVIRIVIISLVALATLFTIISTASNYWVSETDLLTGTVDYHVGLWKYCSRDLCTTIRSASSMYTFSMFSFACRKFF